MIYLDNAATTKIAPQVLKEMMPYLKEEYGNPGTIYGIGRKAADAVALARQRVAKFIGAEPEQIIFTSGGSEANNLVIRGTRQYLTGKNANVVVTSYIEHDSILKAVADLPTVFVGADKHGVVTTDDVKRALNAVYCNYNCCAGLVSIMYANNETGSVNPVAEIGKICAEHGVLFHTDCVQAAGCQPIDVKEIGCDFLSISSHKIHGAKGVGALFVKNKELLSPLVYGGALQEFGLRGGTENVAGIVGFGKACELATLGREEYLETVSYYRRLFLTRLEYDLKNSGFDGTVSVNGESPYDGHKGKTLNIRFDGVDAETLVLMLDSFGVCVSAGSACRSHESQPSHVLLAMGLTPDEARDSIRVSFSEFNTESEVEEAARITANCVATLKGGLV